MNQEQQLLQALKKLWQIQENSQDHKALELIRAHLGQEVKAEDLDIQRKVLLKTREKTEALLHRVEKLEQSLK